MRVTFVDLASLRYRHVLLVVPVLDQDGMLVLRPLERARGRHRLERSPISTSPPLLAAS